MTYKLEFGIPNRAISLALLKFQQGKTKPVSSTQVVLPGTSFKAVAAVKDLIYSGTCHEVA